MDFRGAFDPENRFWSFMDKLTDLFFLAVLWLLFSLPVVTAGAATVALFQFTLKQVDDSEGYALRSFWKAFRENFLPATGLWALTAAFGAFLLFDLRAVSGSSFPPSLRVPFFAFLFVLMVLYVFSTLWAYPLLARYRVPFRRLVPDSLAFAFRHLPSTFLASGIAVLAAWASAKLPFFFWLFLPAGIFASSYVFRRAMDREER